MILLEGKKQISSWAIARKLLFRTNIMDWAYNPEMFYRLEKTLSLAMISPKSKVNGYNGHGNLFFISVDRYHGDSDDSILNIFTPMQPQTLSNSCASSLSSFRSFSSFITKSTIIVVTM